MSNENEIQSACMDSLATYFRDIGVTYRQLWTYSNQQGESSNKFCGDLIGVIDNASLLALEMKALDHATGELSAFDDEQYEVAKAMENDGIPILYCYDKVYPLPYYDHPRDWSWPEETLDALNVSAPSQLDCKTPKQHSHQSLLAWLSKKTSGKALSPLAKFGELIGLVLPSKMRNGLVTVLYSKKDRQAFGLTGDDLERFYEYLQKNPGMQSTEMEKRVKKLFDAEVVGRNKAILRMKTQRKKTDPGP